jgi:hypothetical protein
MSVAHLRDCPGSDERRRLVGTSWAPYIERDVPGNDRPAGSLDHSSKSSVQDRFRGAQPILQIDDKTGSSDLPVGRSVDRAVESYF